jgi:hypothetical protein
MSMQITVGDDRDDDERDRRQDIDDDDRDETRDDRREGRRSSSRDDRDSDGSVSDEEADDDEPEDGWEAEARRLRAALKKSNATGQRRRQQLKELRDAEAKAAETDNESDEDESEGQPKQGDGALDAKAIQRLIEKAKRDGRKEAEKGYKRDLLVARAESALTAAGVSEKAARLLRNEIDLDDFELDAADEIDRLKVEFPDFFRRSRSGGRRINGGDDRDTDRGSKRNRTMTATERQVAALERGARR